MTRVAATAEVAARREPTGGAGSRRVPAACLAAVVAGIILSGIRPHSRADWWLETTPVLLGLPIAVATFRRLRFSDRAYVQATVFVLLHLVGSHYTYSYVPFGALVRDSLGLGRNHYDRLVHFLFGLLMLRPIDELAFRRPGGPGTLGRAYLGIAAVTSWSVLYELTEWIVAQVADPAAGTAYLGTQGDEWDAQKDMAAALVGAVLAAAVQLRERRQAATPLPQAGVRAR